MTEAMERRKVRAVRCNVALLVAGVKGSHLARKYEVSPAYVQMMLRGDKRLNDEWMGRIAEETGASIEFLDDPTMIDIKRADG